MNQDNQASSGVGPGWAGRLRGLISGWGGWPEGRRMLWVGLLVLITAAGGMYYSISQLGKVNSVANSSEDLYWSVAQFQLEMERAKSALVGFQAGRIKQDELLRRLEVASSRFHVFSEPAPVRVQMLLRQVKGFDTLVVDYQQLFNDPAFSHPALASVPALLERIDLLRPQLMAFAVEARVAEVKSRTERLEDLDRQRSNVLYLQSVLWGVICAVILLLSRYSSVKRLASAKQALLEKEQSAHQATVAMELDRTTFLATLSHEIRSPLQSMQVCIELLEPVADGQKTARTALQRLKTSVSHLSAQVHDIMDISAIRNMKLRMNPQPMPLAEVLQATMDVMRPLADAKGLALNYQAGPLPATVLLDEVRLRQVVGNLVSNAIRYTDSGTVTVSVSCLRATGHHELVLQVRDTGVGIPLEYQQRIFQPFIQGKHRRAGSCGLGLSIVKELVNLFGGCIALDSAEGKGACFTVRIPVQAAETPGSQSVLIVDDDADIRDTLAELLQRDGYQVATAETAALAERALEQADFDAVLLDMHLGADSGYRVAERAWNGLRAEHTAIVGMSAYPEAFDDPRASRFAGILAKPFDAGQLRQMLTVVSKRA
ncbi:response regulator [Chromobacterium haemolyticum]|uniref:histidine kinase n=1 Tax=Chromobacterium fluminis TaxID=3044269 RepID=A0ABX0L5B9_9NEIS|nr:hybrid sensor histidine kinase/response regulator [Chromobacterium haemolyticum]NHR06859.1 response regulator [Chromobacterium haemolyticum]